MRAFLLGALWLLASGCMYTTVVRSVQGKAFIAQIPHPLWSFGFGKSKMWNCDATSGEPVCYQAVEVPLDRAKRQALRADAP